jgi:AcrR family transcriptional regulator
MFTISAAARRAQHKAEIRKEILTAARELFVHQGYRSFSMRGLAERIGYSPAAIYKHFRSKGEIFDALAGESFQALLEASEAVKPVPGEDPVDRIKRGMQAYIKFGLKNPGHYRFAFLIEQPDSAQPPLPRPAFTNLRDRVQACVDAGRFHRDDPNLMAQSLWAAAHGITSLLIQRPSFPWASRDRLIRQVVDSAIQGLLSQGN